MLQLHIIPSDTFIISDIGLTILRLFTGLQYSQIYIMCNCCFSVFVIFYNKNTWTVTTSIFTPIFQANISEPFSLVFLSLLFLETNCSDTLDVFPVSHLSNIIKAQHEAVTWFHPFFIFCQTLDWRGIISFTLALKCQ